jgi:hypothetical protein
MDQIYDSKWIFKDGKNVASTDFIAKLDDWKNSGYLISIIAIQLIPLGSSGGNAYNYLIAIKNIWDVPEERQNVITIKQG